MDALSVEGLTKRFGKVVAVNDLSLKISPGAIIGLVGPNGSGKTTLINCCVGLEKPDQGRVLIAGHDIAQVDGEAKRHLAFSPELPHTAWGLTAWEHLEFTAAVLEMDGWEDEAERLLRAFDLWDKRKKLTGGFSKGEDQKVMLSMALLRRPAVLFLDEPLIGLDPRGALALKAEIRAHAARGGSALICSHVLSLVEETCHGIAAMSRGRLVFTGDAAGLRVAARDAPSTPLEEAFVKITQPGTEKEEAPWRP